MLVSFGPHPDQYHAYTKEKKKAPAGATGGRTSVATFYRDTRRRYAPFTFSLITAATPLAIFSCAIWLIDSMMTGGVAADAEADKGLGLASHSLSDPAAQLPIPEFCATASAHAPLQMSVVAGTMHFAATHVALLAICLLAYGAAAVLMRNLFLTHAVLRRCAASLVSLAAPVILGFAAFLILSQTLEPNISRMAWRLFPVSISSACAGPVEQLKLILDQQARIGALCVAVGVASLTCVAALTAYRFEIRDINGAWSDSYVLRHKLNSLLTLFFIGSIMLVFTNVAVTSAMDWSGDVVALMGKATESSAGAKDAKPEDAATGEAKADYAKSARSKAAAAVVESIKTLRNGVANFAGAVGSLLLIGMFVPALYGITSEIEIAGKCHADYDMKPPAATPARIIGRGMLRETEGGRVVQFEVAASQEPDPKPAAPQKPASGGEETYYVAGFKTVQDWKDKHGLKLSFSDLTGSFLAALAPVLSGGLIDLTKMAMGSIG